MALVIGECLGFTFKIVTLDSRLGSWKVDGNVRTQDSKLGSHPVLSFSLLSSLHVKNSLNAW